MTHPLQFLDADCWMGPFRTPLPERLRGDPLQGLLETMGSLGIAEACPTSAPAAMQPAGDGNQRLAAALTGHGNLHPVWALAAHHSGEAPGPAETAQAMRLAGARMARVVLDSGEG